MEKITKKIIAIGGGGFTHESDDTLDQFFLDQCSKKKIKLGFLATASKDDVKKISIFYKKFKNKNLELSHFNLTQKIDGFSSWILNKDIIYVGGGNTSFMLDIWRKNSLDKIFKKAYENGIVLAGVSAGAGCWFDWILSDSVGPGLKPLKGISLISGSCTPHSSEEKRINQFELNIKNGELPPGLAIDDGVAVLFIDGKPSEVYSSRKNHKAYFIDTNKKISLKDYIE
ncbi:MAG: Type 1 glutamine amidotransferase-like domain-containing protein [Pelagibacterales bacterium]|nr:Type 1 glutamine amidotransferase-like domain-containing protein [Candidatus Pelagibacter sp.]MBL6840700.1 Type 1 glutamine amidotransferase-like domain-containing protein [Pelagibacterales bacterium]MBL6862095.1 Type 1 glutamine amidotransferase-like domain-containing protein [Pelagibacterales bacterium]